MLERILSPDKKESIQNALKTLYEKNRDYFLASSFEDLIMQIRGSSLPLVDAHTLNRVLRDVDLSYSFVIYALVKETNEKCVRHEMSRILSKTLHRDIDLRKAEIHEYFHQLYIKIGNIYNKDVDMGYSEIEDIVSTLRSNYYLYTDIDDYFGIGGVDNELDLTKYSHSKQLRECFIYQLQVSWMNLIYNLEGQLHDMEGGRSSPKEKEMLKLIKNRLHNMKDFVTLIMDKSNLNSEVFEQFRKLLTIEYRMGE